MHRIESLQETLPFARGKTLVKRSESLGKGTFVREFPRGGSNGKSARRKHFAKGYTPGRKTRGSTPGIWRGFIPVITLGKIPHFLLLCSLLSSDTLSRFTLLTD
ncbi:hypothetical protein MtrunA17_Chr7g0240461 [Medicago truncatula]|uniref:Uncharacterized protein n=1 Tax=Medicago truncatula TaxID=3880 RepID=G7L5L6_MEDTR|nr:hypothetical protein MTR_7g065200 [Medicago truncatula]RHN46273.1 hypothetical protein MtrunA17_Chr7g0240461 [Medicago truncatula]